MLAPLAPPPNTPAGPGHNRHPVVEADLHFRNVAIFKDPVVDNGFAGLAVDGSPQGPAVFHFPDPGLDRDARVQGLGKAANHPACFFGFPGNEFVDEGPAGETVGAEPVHDGLGKAGLGGEGLIHMEGEDVAREPIEQRLVFGRRIGDDEIRLPLRHYDGRRGSVFTAETAVPA